MALAANEPAHVAAEPLHRLSRQRLNELVWTVRPSEMCALVGANRDAILRACKARQIKTPARGFWTHRKASDEIPPLPEFTPRAAIQVVQPIFNPTLRQKSRDDLYQAVWTTKVTDLARKYGVSDVAILKRCKKLAIPVPGRGYWMKALVGKAPLAPPLPPAPEGYDERRRRELELLQQHDERSNRAQSFQELTDEQFAELVWQSSVPQLCSRFGVGRATVRKRCRKLGLAVPPRGHWNKQGSAAPPARALPESALEVAATVAVVPHGDAEAIVPCEVAKPDTTGPVLSEDINSGDVGKTPEQHVPAASNAVPSDWMTPVEQWLKSYKVRSPARRTQLIHGLAALRHAGLLPSLAALQMLSKEQIAEACGRLSLLRHSNASISTYRSAVNVFRIHLLKGNNASPSERAAVIDKLLEERTHNDRKCRHWELLRDLAIASVVALDQFSATDVISLPAGPNGPPTSPSRLCVESADRLRRYYDALPDAIRPMPRTPFFVKPDGRPMYPELVTRLLGRLCLSASVDRLNLESLRAYGRTAQPMRSEETAEAKPFERCGIMAVPKPNGDGNGLTDLPQSVHHQVGPAPRQF